MRKKILYFEGAGWSDADISKETIGNCRIRTAFHSNEGKAIYLEIMGCKKTEHSSKILCRWEYTGFISHCFYITDDIPNDDCNNYQIHVPNSIEYSESGILEFVNSLETDFDAIKVVPDLGGYCVHKNQHKKKGTENYNYGDEFLFDQEMINRRKAVCDEIYKIEKEEGKEYPNFSMWVDEEDSGMLHLLRHFYGHNKHWVIRTDMGETLPDWMDTMTETKLGMWGC